MTTPSSRKLPLALPPLSGDELLAHPWSDDEITCHGISGLPRLPGCGPWTASLFDIRLRRWYTISSHHFVPRDKLDPSWESALDDPYWYDVLKRSGHRGRDDFSYIEVNPADESLSFSLLTPDEHKPLFLLVHKPPPSPSLPQVSYTDLQNRHYFEYSVETCTWNGERFAFKQALMHPQTEQLDSQISMINRLPHSPYIIHIKAYVVDEDGDLRGMLLPWAGDPIDKVPALRWSYFRDVTYGLRDIHALTGSDGQEEAAHGDVFCRNIIVQNDKAHIIDPNNEGWEYPGDHIAFADVVASLKEKAEGEFDKERMGKLECLLRTRRNFAKIAEEIGDW